jgi:hypothetical protein
LRSPLKLIGFIAAATAAYPISVYAAMGAQSLVHGDFGNYLTGPAALAVFFFAGTVGGFVVFFAAFVVTESIRARWLAPLALVAGALGVVGWILSNPEHPGTTVDPSRTDLLYVVWQSGVAMCFSILLPSEDDQTAPVSGPVKRSKWMVASFVLFFTAILAFIAWQIRGEVHAARLKSGWEAARQQMIAEAPPVEGLPSVEPMPLEKAVINEDVGAYVAEPPGMEFVPASQDEGWGIKTPAHVKYDELYRSQQNPLGMPASVTATVHQYPNAVWARYRAKFPDFNLYNRSAGFTVVTKFQNRVYFDSSPGQKQLGNSAFHWPSGAISIDLSYHSAGPINEEFLRRYLEKYPSSL